MLASLIINGFAALGSLALYGIYGKDWVTATKADDPGGYKTKASLAFLVIILGMIIGAASISNTNLLFTGFTFDGLCYGIWTLCVRKKLTAFSIVCFSITFLAVLFNIITNVNH